MIMEMFAHRILTILFGPANHYLASHSTYELLDAESKARDAVATYEAVVTGTIL